MRDSDSFALLAATVLANPPPVLQSPAESQPLFESLLARIPRSADRRRLRLMLRLLGTPAGGLLLHGTPRSFAVLSPDGRAEAFRRMATHPVGEVRAGARAVKTLVGAAWVGAEADRPSPPAWEAIGYPGPLGPPPRGAESLPIADGSEAASKDWDVAIVGSGAGGSTAAAILAAAGLDVVVLEAGEYRNESDFTHRELDAYAEMYLDGAFGTTADKGIVILAGATLGGGTVINYTTSFGLPDQVRREWDGVAGFDGLFAGEGFDRSVRAVSARLGVNTDHGEPSERDRIMERGLRALGWHADEMPRNAVGCHSRDCGYCTMGCRIGAKRSMLHTYLPDAVEHGARLVTRARVDRVIVEGGRAAGVVAATPQGEVRVRAGAVVLAAGALHTPAIMLRSGLHGGAIGDYLRLHPVTAVWGRYRHRVDPWSGILQTRYSEEFADLDGDGYGFRFETAPVHPLFPAALIGWDDAARFERDILGLGHLGVVGILLRDRDHGKVGLRRDGSAVWKYRISSGDRSRIIEGVRRAAQLHEAAGADEVIASTVRPVRWAPSSGGTFEDFVRSVEKAGLGSNRTSYLTFHQMGTARMGSDPGLSAVDHDNESHELPGLFVMDGSCFPTASGVNPMVTIAAIAHRGALRLAERLA